MSVNIKLHKNSLNMNPACSASCEWMEQMHCFVYYTHTEALDARGVLFSLCRLNVWVHEQYQEMLLNSLNEHFTIYFKKTIVVYTDRNLVLVHPKMKILSLIAHPHVILCQLRPAKRKQHIHVTQLTQTSIHCLRSVDTLQNGARVTRRWRIVE